LAKMTAKYTFAELNDNLKLGQSYLWLFDNVKALLN
jgi:hypothetical protein